ncbi:hypothetical protein GCM10010191_47430 [Actinomadura vinacea]|uniref:LapA family protein n=1 Tax=Actinomadura vinacea TaxID=115336 RepID=A0ABP5WJP6_9ACTN
MIFIGLLLAAAAVTAGAGIVMANDGPAQLTAFGYAVPGVSTNWQVFLTGAAVAVVFMLGMIMTVAGFGRRLRNRRDLRYLREEQEESRTALETEKRRLQREIAQLRRGGPAQPRAPRPEPAATTRPQPQQQRPAPAAGPAQGGAPQPAPTRQSPLASAAARTNFFDRTD